MKDFEATDKHRPTQIRQKDAKAKSHASKDLYGRPSVLIRVHLWLCSLIAAMFMADQSLALEIQKIVPFAAEQKVKIDIGLKSSGETGPVAISAEIASSAGQEILWHGIVGKTTLRPGELTSVQYTIDGLKPSLWGPSSPKLYTLKVSVVDQQGHSTNASVRIGFRSFESRNGKFVLNGEPIFLRGVAINPPGRTIPPEVGESRAFAEAYVAFMKKHNVNIIRLEHDSPVWFDVCDELGMMVFQGRYGPPLEAEAGKQTPPKDFDNSLAAYKELFESYSAHPSIVIYVLSNEMPYLGQRGKAFHDYLSRLHGDLKQWDPTHLFIGNAGYGEGREGDICDVHRYWGWYYNTFVTYNNLRDQNLFGEPGKNQPITFTECVGNYTGPRGDYNLIIRRQLGPQLNWTGHSPNQAADALRYQAFMTKQATEAFRRLRPLNRRLSGIMPFSIFFCNWSGIRSFEEMVPKPAMEQLATSYQPVLLSWELWTPQVYAGKTISPVAHIINDSDDFQELKDARLVWQLCSPDGQKILHGEANVPRLQYYSTWSKPLSIQLPENLPTGDYRLTGEVSSQGRTVSTNECELFVAGKEWRGRARVPASPDTRSEVKSTVLLFDPRGTTATALKKLGVEFHRIDSFHQLQPTGQVVVIGENSWNDAAAETKGKLKEFIDAGGRALCLQPDPATFESNWLPEPVTFFKHSANEPTYPPTERPFRDNMNINPEQPSHPVFAGLDRKRLALWSDYTGWNQTKPGFPKVYPVTTGFRLQKSESLGTTAILANYDRGLEGVALCEMFSEKGSVILCGFDLVNRVAVDPVADRLLANLISYATTLTGHEIHPLIDCAIRWGDYASERGVITGPLNGLVVYAEWTPPPTNPSATPLRPGDNGWNSRPSDQFVAVGRRPLGLYGYSTSTTLKDLIPNLPIGNGYFWLRLPPGLKTMVTKVRNPDTKDGELTISINGKWGDKPNRVPAGQTVTIRTPLNGASGETSVRYMGTKTLVLMETAFE